MDGLARELAGELFELSIALDRVGNAAASRIGITQTDLICLTLLTRHGPMGASEIANRLGLTTAAISAMAARLEAGGYARREIDPTDRRRVRIHVEQAGVERAFGLFDNLFGAMVGLLGEYPRADLERLAELLPRFRGILIDSATTLADKSGIDKAATKQE